MTPQRPARHVVLIPTVPARDVVIAVLVVVVAVVVRRVHAGEDAGKEVLEGALEDGEAGTDSAGVGFDDGPDGGGDDAPGWVGRLGLCGGGEGGGADDGGGADAVRKKCRVSGMLNG